MPITPISSLPPFVTPSQYAELSSQTPESFRDLPTIIRLEVSNVSVSLEPSLPGFSSEEDGKNGSLYVLESVLAFMSSSSTTGKGFQIDYQTITLHALSPATSTSPPSIYCQLDGGAVDGGGGHPGQEDNIPSAGDEDMILAELHIIPSNPNDLEPIFEALSYCATLHPDPQEEGDSGDDEAFFSANMDSHTNGGPFEPFNPENEQEELSEVGRAALEHLESIIDYSNVPPHLRPHGHEPADSPSEPTKKVEEESK